MEIAFELVALAVVVLGNRGLGYFSVGFVPPLSWLVAATTVISAAAYLLAFCRRIAASKRNHSGE